ncbi:alpha/beta hydrolase [Limosilactobacillus fermentum]|nr:alpha/beta hydrolase [Limosilactobacillus fermentum]
MNYYQDQNIATNVMVVRVAPTGAVQVSGSLKGKQNPLIQFIYDWNYSTTYQPQVRELTQVLQVLATKYHVQKLNVIAHSYGEPSFCMPTSGPKPCNEKSPCKRWFF